MKSNITVAIVLLIGFTRFYQSKNPVLPVQYASVVDPALFVARTTDSVDLVPMASGPRKTKHVFIVTTDGLRWQEVFAGADSALLFNRKYTPDPQAAANRFWAHSAAKRRQLLMPFFWSKLAREGQLYGNRRLGSKVDVANNMWFSYPGYNELFSGKPDDARIFMNAKLVNPNESVLECLQRREAYQGKIVAFGTWDAFDVILREKKAGYTVCCGGENQTPLAQTAAGEAFPGAAVPPDFYTWANALHHIRSEHPAVAFLGFDDTDARAHAGEYDQYLAAANRFDAWMAELWGFIQEDPQYRNQTTLLITTDHGRGAGRRWRDHNRLVEGSNAIWLAAIGPDTPATGETGSTKRLYQAQVAQTIAGLLGYTFHPGQGVAPAIETVFKMPSETPVLAQGSAAAGNKASEKENAVPTLRLSKF